MEYLHVLSRPMVINHDHDIIWTEAYMDTKVEPWRQLQASGWKCPSKRGTSGSKIGLHTSGDGCS